MRLFKTVAASPQVASLVALVISCAFSWVEALRCQIHASMFV